VFTEAHEPFNTPSMNRDTPNLTAMPLTTETDNTHTHTHTHAAVVLTQQK